MTRTQLIILFHISDKKKTSKIKSILNLHRKIACYFTFQYLQYKIQVRVPWFHLLLAGSPHDWGYVSEPNYHGALLGYKDTVSGFINRTFIERLNDILPCILCLRTYTAVVSVLSLLFIISAFLVVARPRDRRHLRH